MTHDQAQGFRLVRPPGVYCHSTEYSTAGRSTQRQCVSVQRNKWTTGWLLKRAPELLFGNYPGEGRSLAHDKTPCIEGDQVGLWGVGKGVLPPVTRPLIITGDKFQVVGTAVALDARHDCQFVFKGLNSNVMYADIKTLRHEVQDPAASRVTEFSKDSGARDLINVNKQQTSLRLCHGQCCVARTPSQCNYTCKTKNLDPCATPLVDVAVVRDVFLFQRATCMCLFLFWHCRQGTGVHQISYVAFHVTD